MIPRVPKSPHFRVPREKFWLLKFLILICRAILIIVVVKDYSNVNMDIIGSKIFTPFCIYVLHLFFHSTQWRYPNFSCIVGRFVFVIVFLVFLWTSFDFIHSGSVSYNVDFYSYIAVRYYCKIKSTTFFLNFWRSSVQFSRKVPVPMIFPT